MANKLVLHKQASYLSDQLDECILTVAKVEWNSRFSKRFPSASVSS